METINGYPIRRAYPIPGGVRPRNFNQRESKMTNIKTASWGVIGAMAYGRDYGTKTHAFVPIGDDIGLGHEYTLCGREFKPQTDRDQLRRQAGGCSSSAGAYVCTIKPDLTRVDCNHCRAALKKGE